MGSKTKKIKAAGKFRSRSGVSLRNNYNAIEAVQRKKMQSPFHPKGRVKRIAAGIWKCIRTGKIFASDAYTIQATK